MEDGKFYIPSNKRLKYQKRSKGPKEEYSLRSLVPEITGVAMDAKGFEAARKEVERIVNTIIETLGLEKKKKIPHSKREGFIQITRALYKETMDKQGELLTGQNRIHYEKMKNKEQLSETELVELTDLMKEAVKKEPDNFENKVLLTQVEIEDGVMEWMDSVRELIKEDVDLVDKLAATPKKTERINEYLEFLQEGLHSWREKVHEDLFEESMTYRIVDIANEKGLDYMKVLNEPDSEEFKEVFRTIVEQDSKKLIEQLRNDHK